MASAACCCLDRIPRWAAIGNSLARVAKFADIGTNGADLQVQRVGDVAFGSPFSPEAREQSVSLGLCRRMIFRAVFGGRERSDVPASYSREQVSEVDSQRPGEP